MSEADSRELDYAYLANRAERLGFADTWDEVRHEAGLQ
jgi:hypothetical protein